MIFFIRKFRHMRRFVDRTILRDFLCFWSLLFTESLHWTRSDQVTVIFVTFSSPYVYFHLVAQFISFSVISFYFRVRLVDVDIRQNLAPDSLFPFYWRRSNIRQIAKKPYWAIVCVCVRNFDVRRAETAERQKTNILIQNQTQWQRTNEKKIRLSSLMRLNGTGDGIFYNWI